MDKKQTLRLPGSDTRASPQLSAVQDLPETRAEITPFAEVLPARPPYSGFRELAPRTVGPRLEGNRSRLHRHIATASNLWRQRLYALREALGMLRLRFMVEEESVVMANSRKGTASAESPKKHGSHGRFPRQKCGKVVRAQRCLDVT